MPEAGSSATMAPMTPASSRHARKGWTFGQMVLAAACITIGVGIAAFGFIDLYLTITHLIFRWWGSWAWTVILLGEGAALGAYLAALLADLRLARPPAALRVFLAAYLALFAAGSLTLMVSAGWGSAPDLVSHAIVPVSFFGYLLLAKVLVRHLSAEPPSGLDDALADARRYAMDLLRDRRGIAWRWRPSVPSLLRRQVLTGRLPAAVTLAVKDSLKEYGQPWEPAVREWVLGAEGLNLSAQAEAASRKAVSDITAEAVPVVPETVHEAPSPVPARDRHQAPVRAVTSGGTKRRPKPNPRRMTDDDLMPYVRDALAANADASIADIRRATGTGPDRAKILLRRGQQEIPTPLRARQGAR